MIVDQKKTKRIQVRSRLRPITVPEMSDGVIIANVSLRKKTMVTGGL